MSVMRTEICVKRRCDERVSEVVSLPLFAELVSCRMAIPFLALGE